MIDPTPPSPNTTIPIPIRESYAPLLTLTLRNPQDVSNLTSTTIPPPPATPPLKHTGSIEDEILLALMLFLPVCILLWSTMQYFPVCLGCKSQLASTVKWYLRKVIACCAGILCFWLLVKSVLYIFAKRSWTQTSEFLETCKLQEVSCPYPLTQSTYSGDVGGFGCLGF